MATNYPGAIDTFVNPVGTNLVTSPDHAAQHTNANDAIHALETTFGTTAGTALLRNAAPGDFVLTANAGGTVQQAIFNSVITRGTHTNVLQQNGTFELPTSNGGTFNTPTINGGTLNLGTNSIQGSVISPTALLQAYTIITYASTYASGTAVPITNGTSPLAGTITVPGGGRSVKITAFLRSVSNNANAGLARLTVWKGPVGGGTLMTAGYKGGAAGTFFSDSTLTLIAFDLTPATGLGTYNIGVNADIGGTTTVNATSTEPSFILVELV